MPALADVGDAESAARPDSFAERLERTLAGERRALITQLVSAEVRTVLGFAQTAAVNLEQGLFDLGMDSLTAVELKNRLQNAVARSLPPTLVFDYPSVGALGAFLAQELLGPEAPAGASGALSPDTLGRELARERELLPEEEIAAMLAAKLDELD
jgi:acyl carrier protein